MNIFEKMAAITAELGIVAKNLNVQTTKTSSYKAVSERDVIDAVKPLEEKYKVYSYPIGRKILESATLESETTYNGQTTKKTTFFTRIETTYRFVNTEKPEEYIETTTFAEGIDTQDKGSGKAMTYADKYALMKAYKISTGDDPDQEASKDEHYSKTETRPASANAVLKCEVCNATLTDGMTKSGQPYPAADLARDTKATFGKCLCRDCAIKHRKAKEAENEMS